MLNEEKIPTAFLAIFKGIRQAQAPNDRLRHRPAQAGTGSGTNRPGPALTGTTGTCRLRPAVTDYDRRNTCLDRPRV